MSQTRKPASKKKPAAASSASEGATDLDQAAREQLRASVRALAAEPRFAPARRSLGALRHSPPQSLLLEGGSPDQRVWTALYWAALLNCKEAAGAGQPYAKPCLNCPDCLRFISCLHRDLSLLDGRVGNIKIDDVREMRSSLGQGAQEAQCRVIILAEGQSLMEAAANALLKSLEEPRPGTSFVLTAPQRERLLPTLLSRSWVLTLPWPQEPAFLHEAERAAPLLEWSTALLDFARGGPGRARGTGWMERTAKRGNLDAALAMQLVLLCQRALLLALSGQADDAPGGPAHPAAGPAAAFKELTPASLRILDQALAACQDSLGCNVNPALVLDWLATRLFFVFSGNTRR
ncbi:MAG: DNA polymerase III subunit delta' [Deltaproteobacteria bacterium]|jgi:DNA polymerase-3 subunit delta'|nr:DNA polymerase III subunit delta' [Deltaproteobacteria bacterium]